MPRRVACVCATCGTSFTVVRAAYERGEGQYCSRACWRERLRTQPLDRLLARIDKRNGCWYVRGVAPYEYATLKINGAKVKAHRFMYEQHNGPVPDGLVVMHTCDHKSCVNPDHLCVGTQADNVHDAMRKGIFQGSGIRSGI
jgi:hypothetical protein